MAKISAASTVSEKSFYYINNIIWCHYWRAREDVENSINQKTLLRKIRGKKYFNNYKLDIDHYTKHWLYANKDSLSQDVLNEIKKIWGYEPEENKFLPKGCTGYQFQ